ncbi:hypothetical protein SNE40_015951 [Patella caerulea]|uniref:Microsomal glutathione S-transferase 2 n=1 Tax=Patella caerulea TaxID=87958 RepID=A0AAN8J7V8_PATCE
MTSISVEDLVYPGAVSLLASFQLSTFARRVGAMRMKLKVPYPGTTGDPAFNRAFRAQQNTLEFAPIFFPCLWMSGIFFHPVPASLVGLVYLYARQIYFSGYMESVEGRLPGFKLGVKCLMAFLFMGFSGISTVILRKYTDVDLAQIFWQNAEKYLPLK